jgi:hypothetical protein
VVNIHVHTINGRRRPTKVEQKAQLGFFAFLGLPRNEKVITALISGFKEVIQW